MLRATYRIIPSGKGLTALPKATDCPMTFARTQIDRPYDELSAIQVEAMRDGFSYASQEEVQKLLGAKACELGGDAVLITQDYTLHSHSTSMTGVAVRFRAASPPAGGN